MRTKTAIKPDAILTGDWHLREDTPICRLDDFWETQWEKVRFVKNLQQKYSCPVIHSGDLFNHWKPSPMLLSETIKHIPKDFWTVYGNHDLPQHNLELSYKSGVNTLVEAGVIHALEATHWGQYPGELSYILSVQTSNRSILVWHVMTYTGKEPWPGCTDIPAKKLLKKYPEYDLIVTGHNHKQFTAELDGRLLINPGSITRQDADQIDFEPAVFLWFAGTNTVERVPIPINRDIISREHLDRKKERDDRLEAFVTRLNMEWDADISFEENVNRILQENKVKPPVVEIVNKAI